MGELIAIEAGPSFVCKLIALPFGFVLVKFVLELLDFDL